jgi:predicted nuclease of restriction endonuclease-like (RecB) superfamily
MSFKTLNRFFNIFKLIFILHFIARTIMNNPSTPIITYQHWSADWKQRIKSAQIKAALQVNREVLNLYWELGRDIVVRQQTATWGDGLIPRFAKDLKSEFPHLTGFSTRNLFYIRKWYLFYHEELELVQQVAALIPSSIVQQLAAQLPVRSEGDEKESPNFLLLAPWGHHQIILDKCSDINVAIFYLKKTIQNNWSRDTLRAQMKQNLYERQGKAITNFEWTLPKPQSDLARDTLKNPYNFDFLNLGEEAMERDVEQAMLHHVEKVLLELGQGFALLGRQYKITVAEEEFYIDLLFYHTRLHAYMVVELKGGAFKPEYTGKLNFYCSAVDDLLRSELDQATIGLILCREAGKQTIVEYALRDIQKPLGVAEYILTQTLPERLRNILPTTEELERELDGNFDV